MPANLTPQYYAAEEAYKKASTPEDKIEALQEMLAVIPKHKGTEKIQGDLKRRLSKLREEGQRKAKGSTFNPFFIEKQGAGQVVLVGYPNTGKSALVSAVTRAQLKIAAYPFTTAVPAAGMMPYKDILIQLVDTPPITEEGAPAGLLSTIRASDLLLVIADASSDESLEQVEDTLSFLQEKRIIRAGVEGDEKSETGEDISKFLPYLTILSKMDLQESEENLAILKELKPELLFLKVSINDEEQMASLKKNIFEALNIIRVYTKAPGKQPDLDKPFVLKKGDTVLELAYSIHRDFPEQLKNARVWGSAKFEGQTVARDYELQDGDIVELNV